MRPRLPVTPADQAKSDGSSPPQIAVWRRSSGRRGLAMGRRAETLAGEGPHGRPNRVEPGQAQPGRPDDRRPGRRRPRPPRRHGRGREDRRDRRPAGRHNGAQGPIPGSRLRRVPGHRRAQIAYPGRGGQPRRRPTTSTSTTRSNTWPAPRATTRGWTWPTGTSTASTGTTGTPLRPGCPAPRPNNPTANLQRHASAPSSPRQRN